MEARTGGERESRGRLRGSPRIQSGVGYEGRRSLAPLLASRNGLTGGMRVRWHSGARIFGPRGEKGCRRREDRADGPELRPFSLRRTPWREGLRSILFEICVVEIWLVRRPALRESLVAGLLMFPNCPATSHALAGMQERIRCSVVTCMPLLGGGISDARCLARQVEVICMLCMPQCIVCATRALDGQ